MTEAEALRELRRELASDDAGSLHEAIAWALRRLDPPRQPAYVPDGPCQCHECNCTEGR